MQNTFSATDYLHHIVEEAEFIVKHTSELSFDGYLENIMIQKAVFRSLEVIGEATKNIDPSFRNKYPSVEWREIAGMRDKLIHHYFDVDDQIVYNTCKFDIPELLINIKTILAVEEASHTNPDSN